MSAFFASGHAVDVVLAVMAIEALILFFAMRERFAEAMGLLLPGALILLALRAALTDAGWHWVAFWLAASLPAHLWDLRRRLG